MLAFYANQTFNFLKERTIDIGIRSEHSFINYDFSNQLGNQNISNYINLLYNIKYNWKSSNKWNQTISLRKQIIRPNYNYLNPFNIINSDVTSFTGNLNIEPTKYYSLSYERNKNRLYLYSQLGVMNDFISTLSTLKNNTIVDTYQNFDNLFYGAIGSQYVNFFFNKKWRSKNGINFNYIFLKDGSFNENIGRSTPIFFVKFQQCNKISE